MRYKLAGAYDSNIALLVTTGDDRRQSYDHLREVLRRTVLRGPDLQTNLQFHYGLVHWFLANGVDAKPTTRFVVPYLTLVGELPVPDARRRASARGQRDRPGLRIRSPLPSVLEGCLG
ncbi:MAG: hypothetical protein JRF54_12600 [Deltaproteobacteria bacterium]|nr:hypothetical protein [Deltaproteobacteria bacterium]